MILLDYPGPEQRPLEFDMICPEMGWSNLIALTHPDDTWYPATQGTLSIKCAFNGVEHYSIDGHRIPVEDNSYLIVNQGQRYSSTVEGPGDVESLCIFFRPGFAEGSLRAHITPDDQLLADPAGPDNGPIHFFEKLYPHDDSVSPLLHRIRNRIAERTVTRGWAEEQFHELLLGMLAAHRNVIREIRKLPALRSSTRVEIYRRLSRAREFMHAEYARPINLTVIARAAALSPHHFLRLFKSLYGITPHQYLTHLRVERARILLSSTSRSITDICFDLGFESPTSFSLLFSRHVGMSPSRYRGSNRG